MNESHKLRAEGKKSQTKKKDILYDSIYIKFKIVQNQCILVVVARVVGALGK